MDHIRFCFFISGEENEVFNGSSLWKRSLSGKKFTVSSDSPGDCSSETSNITIGDYFSACRRFLSKKNYSLLINSLETAFNKTVSMDQLDKIDVFLEKHGAFYHPLRILVELNTGAACSFVLNGAVSGPGLSLIEAEYHCISQLNKAYIKGYLPQVFGVGIIKTEKGRFGFFLGQWYDGYKEFHATKGPDRNRIVIWDSDGSHTYLSEIEALPIYQEISRILTYYYNIETFEQVFPWHHAAGDFVVKIAAGKVHVRLITVRGYKPLTEFAAQGIDKKAHILPSLLIFFLNLTLRMRLDRWDGTGRTVMLGHEIIKATIDGFFNALDQKTLGYDYGNLKLIFLAFFRQFSQEQVSGLLETILEASGLTSSEREVIEENLEFHCRSLHSIFKTF